jgi:2-phosphosulfolactate phosphatase
LAHSQFSLDVFQLPGDVSAGQLDDSVAVAVDVLRASTTIITALANGARRVVPCLTVEEAAALQAKSPGWLAGGERNCLPIPGFDFGNSPSDYGPAQVDGRSIAFTTTNGTRAINACRGANPAIVGGFVNCQAVATAIRNAEKNVAIVCAGTDGMPTLEDSLLAGRLCLALCNEPASPVYRPNVAARAAMEMWRTASRRMESGVRLADVLAGCQGGKNLVTLGLKSDIQTAAQIDRYSCVPFFDKQHNAVVV